MNLVIIISADLTCVYMVVSSPLLLLGRKSHLLSDFDNERPRGLLFDTYPQPSREY